MRTWIIEAQEKWCDHPIKTSYTGNFDRTQIIKFFGLDKPDIEWYNITEYNNEDK